METYIVKVIRVNDNRTDEEVVLENDFEFEDDMDVRNACAYALKISYYGCVDD